MATATLNLDSFDDIEERYNPGESYGTASYTAHQQQDYGKKMEKIPEKYQHIWKDLVSKVQQKDLFARIEEVKRAADGGFYWRSIFDAYWSDFQFTWLQGGSTDGNNTATLNYPLNIYQQYGRSYIKIVGHVPDVHMVASGTGAEAYRVAEAANYLREDIESLNDVATMAQDFARIAYTDGRYGIYTRWVADGGRFGYYDQDEVDEAPEGVAEGSDNPPKKKPRLPKGGEVMTIYGVPWLKVPINMRSQHEFTYLALADEIELSAAKSLYPHIAKKIKSGEPGPAEYMFDRTTRIALTQGLHLVSQMAESFDQLPTIQTIWVRPCFFSEIEDEECRKWFEDTYPDGGKVVFLGDQYAESCNESMDDHWVIGHAVRGHGQATPAYGYSMLTEQDAFNDAFDLEMETHMRAIRAWHGDPNVFDFPAYSKQKSRPGAAYPLKHDLEPDININNKYMIEPQVEVSAQLLQLRSDLAGPLAQTLTGIAPVAVGQADENNTTLGGISILRAASRGEAGTSFVGFIEAYSRAMEQAIRIGAKYRIAEANEKGILTLRVKEDEDALIDLVGLRDNNIYCVTDTDQTYPFTYEEKQMSLTTLVLAAAQGDKAAAEQLEDPANAETFRRLRGIPNLKSSTGSIGMKVKQLIGVLLKERPQPIPQAAQAALLISITAEAQGQEAPPPNKYQLFKSSQQPGPLDNAQSELTFFTEWVYSPSGQRQKLDNPDGFFNVELYALNLQQLSQKAAVNALQMQAMPGILQEKAKREPVAKHPSESIAFKDLGPSGKVQLGAQAGLDLRADSAADLAGEQMGDGEEPTS